LLLFFICIAFFPLNAAGVSFLVIESGLDKEAAQMQSSGLWESGLLDVFFEAGHIVTNAPVMRFKIMPDKKLPDEVQNDLHEAIEGGMEYFIIALLEYQTASAGQKPTQITLRLFRINPLKLLFEHKYSNSKAKNAKEEFDNLKQAARILLGQIE
jgi:hypothetical protein